MKEEYIGKLKGIGPKTESLFAKLGIERIEDLIHYYPFRYIEYKNPDTIFNAKKNLDKKVVIKGKLIKDFINQKKSKFNITKSLLYDNKDSLEIIWYNLAYLSKKLFLYKEYIFVGTITNKRGIFVLEQAEVYTPDEYCKMLNHLHAIYSLTKGLTNKSISKNIALALNLLEDKDLYEYLPKYFLEKYSLISYKEAIKDIHFPSSYESFKLARTRLVFDELFQFIYSIRKSKERFAKLKSKFIIKFSAKDYEELENILSFELSTDQKKVIKEILFDMNSQNIMNRLIQGDVGSGKTIISIFAMYACYKNSFQSLIMVPTEVLAKQHYKTLSTLFDKLENKPKISLLTGSMSKKQHLKIYEELESGQIDIIVGTHALISEKVKYKNLALVITDEQHRFGVRQRRDLSQKGDYPHILVMSATPIPRTLAIILYGDMDISVVNTKPLGRLPIKNALIKKEDRIKAYKHILNELKKGYQAYVICPMVEESENINAQNVIDYTEILKSFFPKNYKISYLHGKLKQAKKDEIMQKFLEKEIDILVSTTVIEVGIDVKNATVMLIEDAQRFGLASLHQLRGRVGRSNIQSYCIFVLSSDSENAKKRLEIISSSNDGFYIAKEDMKLRGAGELFGMAQSGEFSFELADIYTDSKLLADISNEVNKINELDFTEKEKENLSKKMLEYDNKIYNKLIL